MNTNNVIKYVILTGLWAILLVPFIVINQMFFPFITGKNFFFRIIVEVIFALWVYLAFADTKFRPKFSWVALAVGLFVAVMAVADFFAVNPFKAFWSNYERMDGWITLIHLLMYLLVFGSMMKTEKVWLWFFRSSLAMSVIMIALSTKEWLSTGAERVSVTLGNPIYVAVYFLFNFFFALILLYKDVIVKKAGSLKPFLEILKDWKSYVYFILAFLCVFGIWRTATRGVILGLIGGLIVSALIIAIFERKNAIMKKTAIGGLIIIAILIAGFLVFKNTTFVKNNVMLNRLSAISWSNVTSQGQARQYVWPMAIKGFQEKPLLGWGQDGFNYVFNKYYDSRMYGQEQWFDRAHNTPLDVLVAGGAVGLLSYLGIFVAALWLIWKRREKLGITDAALLVGVLAGYFFQNLFVFDNLTSYIFFFVVLAYLHSSDTENGIEVSGKYGKAISEDLTYYVIAPILLVILGISLWYFNAKPLMANLTLIDSLRTQSGGLSANLESLKKALSYNSLGNSEIREQAISVATKIIGMKVDAKIKQDFVDLAYTEVQKQVALAPNDARYQLFTGAFLDNLGQYQAALPYLKKAVELSPKKQTMIFELVKCFSYLGDKEQALKYAKEAYESEPQFVDARNNYIAAAVINGNDQLVKELMGTTTTISDERIVRAYLLNASDYLQKNDKYSAVKEVEKAAKLSPGFASQAKDIINGIWNGTVK